MSQLTGPFNGDIKTPPGAKDNANGNHFEVSQLNQAPDGDVIKPAFYAEADSLKASPGALDTPMGTAIPNPSFKG